MNTLPNGLMVNPNNTYSTDNYVFFWGSYLSNWAKSKFVYKDKEFTSSEQALMFEKAITFNDIEASNKILATNDPKIQKAIGRTVKNYNDVAWAALRYSIMIDILKAKFEQNSDIRKQLLATNNKIIVESSPSDSIFGIGMHASDPDILNESKWKGTNLLGKALMEVRSYIRGEEVFE